MSSRRGGGVPVCCGHRGCVRSGIAWRCHAYGGFFRMRIRRFGVLAAVVGTLAAGLTTGPAQAEIGPGASPETVTGLPLGTWQTNGPVMTIQIVNNVAYVGGNFTKVRPPGAAVGASTEVVRNRLAAFDATT